MNKDRQVARSIEHPGSCLQVLRGHTSPISAVAVFPDARIISWDQDNTFRVWATDSGACLSNFRTRANIVALEGNRVLTWYVAYGLSPSDNTLQLWSAETGENLTTLEGHAHAVKGAMFLPDGRILSWSRDRTLRVWSSTTGVCTTILKGHTDTVWNAFLLSNRRVLSMGGGYEDSFDNTMRVWSLERGESLLTIEVPLLMRAILVSGGRILSWSIASQFRLWSDKTGDCLAEFPAQPGPIRHVAILPNNRFLSLSGRSSDEYMKISVFSWESGAHLVTLKESKPSGVRVFADGRLLTWTGSEIRVWSSESGKCLAHNQDPTGQLNGALILQNGQILSWSKDATLRVWSAESGECISVLEGHEGEVLGARNLSEERIVSWSENNTLRVWRIGIGDQQEPSASV